MNNNPTGRLILILGRSAYITFFMKELKACFENLGYETVYFNPDTPGKSITDLVEFAKKPITAALTFNNQEIFLGQKDEDSLTLWDEFSIPFISLLMDHPVLFDMHLKNPPAQTIVLTIDRNHMRFVSRFYPRVGTIGFLPYGGAAISAPVKPIRERSIDVMYAGSSHGDPCSDPKFDSDGNYICSNDLQREILRVFKSDASLTLEDAVEISVQNMGLSLSDEELFEIILDMNSLHLAASFHYRELMLKALVENGINVTLFGGGWENKEWVDNPHLDYRGPVSPAEAAAAMQDAKIVLSTTTWFKDGVHDRVFNGMMAGAVVVSDTSKYMLEELDDSEIVFFELNETATLPQKIKSLLENPDKMQLIADNGRKKAEAKHSWQERVRELHEDLLSQLTPPS